MKRLLSVVIVVLSILPFSLHAQEGWQYKLSPYLWFAGIKGDVSTISGLPAVSIDISSSDALSDNEASLMLFFEARKNRHGILADFIYTDTQSKETLDSTINLILKSTSKNTLFSLAYAYGLVDQSRSSVDVYGGLRYWDIETKLGFSGGMGLLAGTRIKSSESWIDPFVAVKGHTYFGDSKFYTVGWAGVGGFGVGSDLFYDLSANLGYQWTNAIGTVIGYRYLDVDYDEDDFLYDIRQEGWQIGLTWAF